MEDAEDVVARSGGNFELVGEVTPWDLSRLEQLLRSGEAVDDIAVSECVANTIGARDRSPERTVHRLPEEAAEWEFVHLALRGHDQQPLPERVREALRSPLEIRQRAERDAADTARRPRTDTSR